MHISHEQPLVALYDATTEELRMRDTTLAVNARELGAALGKASLGVIARIGSPVIISALSATLEQHAPVIALSPAASKIEHEQAFRLPPVSVPLIYSGRGALGADVMALASAKAVCIIGSSDEELEGILGCIGEGVMLICILSNEEEAVVRTRIKERYNWIQDNLLISDEPALLVRNLSDELRKRKMNEKHSK